MNRAAIWISKELFSELNKERGKIKAKTGREPTWDEFLKKMLEIYRDVKEEVEVIA